MNFIQLIDRNDKRFDVLFDIDQENKDFLNIRIREEFTAGEYTAVPDADLDAIKDAIAEEIIVSTMHLTLLQKEGKVALC